MLVFLLVVYLTLIKKIISNADAANKLIFEGHIKEAKIILRSAVESVILITYLSQFLEKIEDYLDEAQILKIKNNFIIYKNMRDGEPILLSLPLMLYQAFELCFCFFLDFRLLHILFSLLPLIFVSYYDVDF